MKLLLSSKPYSQLIKKEGLAAFFDLAGTLEGLSGVELWADHVKSSDESFLADLKRNATFQGLSLSVFSLQVDFGFFQEVEREKEMESAGRWAMVARDLGAQIFRVNCGTLHGKERDFVELVRCLQVVNILLEETGLMLGVENDTQEDGLITTPAEIENLLDSMEGQATLLCADLNSLSPKDPYGLAARFIKRGALMRVQMDGKTDMPRLGNLLKEGGYRRFLSLDSGGEMNHAALQEGISALLSR